MTAEYGHCPNLLKRLLQQVRKHSHPFKTSYSSSSKQQGQCAGSHYLQWNKPSSVVLYLPRSLHVDGDDVEAIAAELAGPAAPLADPLQQAVLVGVTHRAVTPTRVQQLTLETGQREKVTYKQKWFIRAEKI